MPPYTATGPESILVARSEYKYHVPPCHLAEICDWLRRYCIADTNAGTRAWYSVYSLYFDSKSFRLYWDAAEGAPYRLKLRARAYGAPSGPVKLEIKRRILDRIIKSSAMISLSDWRRAGSMGALVGMDTPAVAEFQQMVESLHATPRMLVHYERLAFSSYLDDYVRITFDRNMSCQPVREWDLAGDPRAWLPVDAPAAFGESDSAYVMEIKFAGAPPQWVRDLAVRFGLERRGFSKYCRAVRRGVLGVEPAWSLVPGFRSVA